MDTMAKEVQFHFSTPKIAEASLKILRQSAMVQSCNGPVLQWKEPL